MAAVFPPPPPDPYKGLNGLDAAWERWRRWIMEDLPRQWAAFMGLIQELGGVPTGGGGPPPPPPPPPVRPYPIPEGWGMADLSPSDQALAADFMAAWQAAYAGGVPVTMWNRDLRNWWEPPSVVKIAIAALGWVGLVGAVKTEFVPWDSPEAVAATRKWFPGLAFNW